jgi:hypothetical protein
VRERVGATADAGSAPPFDRSLGRVLCHTGIPTKGAVMWWLYIAILLGVFLAVVVALRRRGSGGQSRDASYSAETAAAQAARQMDRGGMGGG